MPRNADEAVDWPDEDIPTLSDWLNKLELEEEFQTYYPEDPEDDE